jgi:hypothetical protein
VKLQTLTPTSPLSADADPWVSQTPHNPQEALSQLTLVKSRITRYQESSPTSIFETVVVLAKDTERLAYEMTLLSAEVYILQVANEALSKRYRAKKTRVCQGGILTIEDTQDIIAQKDIDEQVRHDVRIERSNRGEDKPSKRRYETCEKASYNTRTYQEDIDISSLSNSESDN